MNELQTGSGYLPWTWWVSPKRVYVEPTQGIGMKRLKHELVDLPRDIEQVMKMIEENRTKLEWGMMRKGVKH